jgi:gluconolactonase
MRADLADTATLETLFSGTAWGEGPVWLPREERVRWSDIPNDRILEYDPGSGRAGVHRTGVGYTNGRTLDHSGAVLQCSHGRRAIERDAGGELSIVVDRFEGRRLNSPNDVVVARDGTIWFTDPPYGIHHSGAQGHPGEEEYGGSYVFRYDERTGRLDAVVTDMWHPNGLAFSPDESILYVSDTSVLWHADGHHHIRAYDVVDGTCRNGRVFAVIEPGVPDGFRVDADGRVWTSSGDGVQVYSAECAKLSVIELPEVASNLCFGGRDRRDLYITGKTSLFRVRLN